MALFKKTAASVFFFTGRAQTEKCLNIIELISSCVTAVSEQMFQSRTNRLTSIILLNFLALPQKQHFFSFFPLDPGPGIWTGWLVWNQDAAGVFGVIVSLKHPFPGHFLFSIRQHDLFKYFDVFTLIHVINRPDTRV